MATEQSVDLVDDDTVGLFTKAVLLAALTAALAQISIPLPGTLPPFSLQPFGMFFAGLLLGPLWGGVALLLYVLVGIAGAPVFSNANAGLGYVIAGQGTGGFLVGFLVGAVVAGAIAHRSLAPKPVADLSVPVQVVAFAAAIAVVYAIGIPWLAVVTGLPLARAAAVMAPYIPLDLLKLGIAIAIVQGGYLAGR
ncbi:biotin transport system substrate-specific component [Haloarcula quadrata]|jgi:biotin transport system substrate-specific component|uniref:Biotin transporter BioY n=2 Tax=Haloarcula TaxID=2237 RepID=Q5UZS1_HALMA|nr:MULTISPECIES: biotin transporter BioY [Haloarcula]AAV47232.1 dethiobiotin synthesis protein [Haloarcula marismortui ATCC 43049]NHN65360.1 biotin transporter BioY [Haloarcula sp. JP-Z28]QCP91939.1 biotin transporter BioY [Haloarcula marismortui ATCC 43049]RKS81435.1 biotin transport system substrate-specific component [Haloarcula quadrata]